MNTILFDISGNRVLVDIDNIQEILEKPSDITPIVDSNSYTSGLIDLRGEGITIINLKRLINASEEDRDNDRPVVIILKNKNGHKIGVVVDNIHHVQEITEDNEIIQNHSEEYSKFFPTVVKVNEKLTFIFNVESLFETIEN